MSRLFQLAGPGRWPINLFLTCVIFSAIHHLIYFTAWFPRANFPLRNLSPVPVEVRHLVLLTTNNMPDNMVAWVSGPTERGTLTLIWSCVVTMFACTWTVLHLNLPGTNDSPRVIALRKAKWMIINVFFPEFVFSKAVCDLRLALQELRDFDNNLRDTHEEIAWTTHHSKYDIRWAWEIEYPGRWSGILYDLLRLDRPRDFVRGDCPLRRFLAKFSFGFPPLPTSDPENVGFELEPRSALVIEDHGRTAAQQPHSESIYAASSPKWFQQSFRENQVQNSSGGLSKDNQVRTHRGVSASTGAPGRAQGTGSTIVPSQRQDLASQTMRNIPRKLGWTIVHSYYVQMGGLVCPGISEECVNTIPASHFTSRSSSLQGSKATNHPIMHLILKKDDILDKSKADGLLKSIAVFQVAWTIINVVVRHITKLPIFQLEIATIAFAIMAIMIYVTNWWKPQDISQPTMLERYGSDDGEDKDGMQSSTRRVWAPLSTIQTADSGVRDRVERVKNDNIWLGDDPLLYYLMAGSSLIFSGVHCLAWNFEFPTHAEIICWRVSSLKSAALPAVALATSVLGDLPVTYFWDRYSTSKLSDKLRLISPVEFRRHITKPAFQNWGVEELGALLRIPRELRDWEERPTSDVIKRWETEGTLHDFTSHLAWTETSIRALLVERKSLKNRCQSSLLVSEARLCKRMLEENPKVLEFWRDYEDFLGTKYPQFRRAVDGRPITTCLQQILDVVEEVLTETITFNKWTERVANLVTVTNAIFYIVARLVILVLLFIPLRSAPEGLYQDTAWSHFLPKISDFNGTSSVV